MQNVVLVGSLAAIAVWLTLMFLRSRQSVKLEPIAKQKSSKAPAEKCDSVRPIDDGHDTLLNAPWARELATPLDPQIQTWSAAPDERGVSLAEINARSESAPQMFERIQQQLNDHEVVILEGAARSAYVHNKYVQPRPEDYDMSVYQPKCASAMDKAFMHAQTF